MSSHICTTLLKNPIICWWIARLVPLIVIVTSTDANMDVHVSMWFIDLSLSTNTFILMRKRKIHIVCSSSKMGRRIRDGSTVGFEAQAFYKLYHATCLHIIKKMQTSLT